MGDLQAIGEAILARLEAKHAQREAMLALSRSVVQHAARAIRAIHRGEWSEAEAEAAAAGRLLAEMHAASTAHPDLASAGYMLDAQKELAEAHLTRALVRGTELPSPADLGVDDAAWLNGLGEAGGELRRAALDAIRRDDTAAAEAILERMQDIYAFLTTVDFPAVITRNIKQTNDMVRGVTERTRGDLTLVMRQERLQAALDRFEARAGAAGIPIEGDDVSR
ncbi:haloacid dehalogenase [bacterium]|nr:haloacid dehalogenase [Chloroflexi bacterium CFX6]RIL09453.1 MAG: haloacid dehalogenase [bacterium]